MKTFNYIALALTALLLVTSCAIDEMWSDVEPADEQKVLTFKPKFEDFETVTKAIGDGWKVDKLLVQVYEGDNLKSYEFVIKEGKVTEDVSIPFFYGKTYEVYFWAYKSVNSHYTISERGLKYGVSVNYPDTELSYDSLESLDAFYAVETIDLSDDQPDNTSPSLTRPFAQVNLMANKDDLLNAQANMVEFTINVAETFSLASPTSDGTTEKTFTFTSTDNFQNTEEINGNVYLGTTYLFVPSSGKVTGKVKLYAGNNVLKSAENIEIPLAGNKRTNLVFSGFQVTVPDWDSDKETVPGVSDGWITITEPEQLAALLMAGTTENTQVRIGSTLNMEKMPQDVKNKIVGKSFSSLTLDGNGLTIKNFSAPAFFANATNLTLSNLTLENVHITAATHVGVLVNELKGNGTFTNVTVKGSSATTTNGAAGGFVGRSIRTSEKDRKETLALTFTKCRIEGTDDKKIVATGSGAEGKFVGLFSGYDNGEKLVFTNCTSENAIVADYNSRYVEGNEGAWLAGNNYSAYNGFLGDETYLRGKVYFGGENEATNRFCPKWDGTTNTTNLDIEPLLANVAYDAGTTAGTNKFVVYSAFDLAGVRKKTPSPAAIYLMNHVDLFGQGEDANFNVPSLFLESANNSTDDNKFTSFSTVALLEGFNHTIYNLKIEHLAQGSTTAAFIGGASGTTYHQNITFDGCCVVSTHKVVTTDAKAYGAILCCNPGGTYNVKSVKVINSKVFALQKVGIICSRVTGTSKFENCTVDNCYIENYKCDIEEDFATLLTDKGLYCQKCIFYPHGEVGGFIGFLQANSTITSCSVSNTTINCYGQKDKSTKIGINKWLAISYSVPGRHVNQFIGDIRTDASQSISMTDCTANANAYGQDKWNHSYWGTSTDLIGCAYAIPIMDDSGTLSVNGSTINIQGM